MVPDSVRRRVLVPQELPPRNVWTISDTRHHQLVRKSAALEKQMSNIERLAGFLAEVILGLTAACYATAGAATASGEFFFGRYNCIRHP
jgi:hypothetical protein